MYDPIGDEVNRRKPVPVRNQDPQNPTNTPEVTSGELTTLQKGQALDSVTRARVDAILSDERRRGGGPPEGVPQGAWSVPAQNTEDPDLGMSFSMDSVSYNTLKKRLQEVLGTDTSGKRQLREILSTIAKTGLGLQTPATHDVTADKPEWQR